MQNKGPIRLFIIVLAVVSIYQLFFTWKANNVENQAHQYAVSKAEGGTYASNSEKDYAVKKLERYYLDSISDSPVIDLGVGSWRPIQYTYADVKNNELNLGLDLRGGVSVILEISVADVIKGLADNSSNPTFNKALLAAQSGKIAKENLVEVFFKKFDEQNKLDATDLKLSDGEVFGQTAELMGMSDEQIKDYIRKEVKGATTRAFEILRGRIDKFGVSSPNIQFVPGTDQISIELAGASDAERVRKLLQSSAALEFWTVHTANDLMPALIDANAYLKEKAGVNAPAELKDTVATAKNELDSLKNKAEKLLAEAEKATKPKTDEELKAENPLFGLLNPSGYSPSAVIGTALIKDTAAINAILNSDEVQGIKAKYGLEYAKLLWANKPIAPEFAKKNSLDRNTIELYAIAGNSQNEPALGGDVIADASESYDRKSMPAVSMSMNSDGASKWAELTAKNINKSIAIVLDNSVYTAPNVQTAITDGRSEISGNFTIKEAKDLASILKSGKLPAPARIIQSEVVGPSLGQESINAGMISFLIAFVIVLIWMFFYYSKTGLFADVALFVNILFIFGILASLGATLTLPGIAGIILTLGMAVDANVIIYERIKEELRNGKSAKDAVKDGYSNAYSSIIDANFTTFITSVILFWFGKGPIQGFATTMMIGIITSLISAIFISRMFIEADLKRGRPLRVFSKPVENWFQNMNFAFIPNRKKFYIFSATLIVVAFGAMAIRGFDKSIDFVGGRTYTIRFDKPVATQEIAASLSQVLVENGANQTPEVKTYGTDKQVKIATKFMSGQTGAEIDDMVDQKIFEGLQKFLPEGFSYDEFRSGEGLGVMESMVVGPTIADDIKTSTIWAVSLSLVAIFLYILLRFRKWQFSAGAIAASVHNVIIVCGVFALLHGILPFSLQIDQTFIAAILTVIGYALNDNVIVFDRIREEMHNNPRADVHALANAAINKTLSRTINTSLTTLFVILVIFFWGGDAIRGFMLAMVIGVVVGTYSSIFIATPVMLDLLKKKQKKELSK